MSTSDPTDLWASSRGEGGDDTSMAESEEEQSGLIPLLQQIPVPELREIARQRGWRLKGPGKADYASELAALLSNPTETARAVTGLPETLREGLRAAFVADDGSGITATIMALTMTALRGAAGPGIKPVEAAAILSDLARWGLLLQWRDSLYGEGRYVLPWQVQRLVPPLPGWCSSAEAPGTAARSQDARQVVDSLCAVWKTIAAREPAVRLPLLASPNAMRSAGAKAPEGAPADLLAGRRMASVLQGWPYDPLELRGWAANRRRGDTAARTLSVPPTPLLTTDISLAQSAGLGTGEADHLADGERFEFVCRVLCELGLASIQSGHLIAQQEEMAGFLQLAVPDQHRRVAQAYLSLLDWSELDWILRQDARLLLWHRPYFTLPYDQFRSMLLRIRHMLLRILASAGEHSWCTLNDVESALRILWPHFTAPLQSERQSWLSQAWGLASRPEAQQPEPAEAVLPGSDESRTPVPTSPASRGAVSPILPRTQDGVPTTRGAVAIPEHAMEYRDADGAGRASGESMAAPRQNGVPASWEAGQGAFLRTMLEGPLYWLGFVELGYSDGRLVALRLHGLADWMWGRPPARFEIEAEHPGEALRIDEGGGTISMRPGSIAPQAHMFLGRIARLEEASPERFVYRLHAQTALATFEGGASLADLLAEWERVMSQPAPPAVRDVLSDFWTRYGQVRLYEGFSMLELSDEVTLRELEASTSLGQHIVARISPRLVLVPDEAVDALMREFATKDYLPKEVG